MAVTPDGASSGSDPVLSSALAEMTSDGAFTETSDPAASASQPSGTASAGTPAAPSQAAGDAGPGHAADSSAPAPAPTDPAVPSAQAPADPAAADPGAADPFAGTEPFRYGEGKTLEGVFRVPGEGLLVPEDKVSVITQLAERAESFDRVTQDLQTRTDAYERLSAWHTKDGEGKDTVINGLEGLLTMRTEFGKLAASFHELASIFQPDAQGRYPLLAQLVATAQGPDGPYIVPDKATLEHLLTRTENAEMRAAQDVRSKLASLVTPPPAQPAPPDIAKEAPAVIAQAVKAAGVDAKLLTDKDTASLAAQLPRYIRTVTAEDRRTNPSLREGGPIVDRAFTDMVKERADLRAEQKRLAEAAEKAGKFNAGQDKGRQPAPVQPKPTPAAPKAGEQTKPSRTEAWSSPLEQALEEMSIPIR